MSAAAKPRPRPLVTGSLAYDFVMTFAGRFVDHIERGRRRGVSVAFESPTMRRHFGGCAGNIAYGLKMLGDEPRVVATVGEDFAPYRARLRELQIEDGGIKTVADSLTAQAYILTDNENSQLIFFHPGAMHFSHIQAAAGEGDYALAVVAPDGRQGMLRHARDLAARRIPFVFDPGQATPTFAGEELIECLNLAQIAIFNRHEFEMFSKATGVGVAQAASRLRALVVTDGETGSTIYAQEGAHKIEAAVFGPTVDPTGCGDAYRAGLCHAILRGWDWPTAGRLAAVVAGLNARADGSQGYAPTIDLAREKYREKFAADLPAD